MHEDYTIRWATEDDAEALPAIEAAAGRMFSAEDVPPEILDDTTDAETFATAARNQQVRVAVHRDGEIVSFSHCRELEGYWHLQELDTLPDHGRKGIGRAMVMQVIDDARARGMKGVTGTTYSHVAWNAPFYATCGFETLTVEEAGETLREIMRREGEAGLVGEMRVAMRLRFDKE